MQTPSSPGWSSPFPSASCHRACAPCPWWFWWHSTRLAPVYQHFSFVGGPQTGHITIFHVLSRKCWLERNNRFPPIFGYTPVSTAQHLVNFHCCQGTLLAHVEVVVHQDLPEELFPSQSVPSLHHRKNFFILRGRTLHLSSLSFIRFLSTHSSSLSRSFWMPALPTSVPADSPTPCLMSPVKLMRYVLYSPPGHW